MNSINSKQLLLLGEIGSTYEKAVSERDSIQMLCHQWPCGKDEAVILSLLSRMAELEAEVGQIKKAVGIHVP